MNGRWGLHGVEGWLVQVFLVGAVASSIILDVAGLDIKWYVPGIFMVLFVIYRRLNEIDNQPAGVESRFYSSNSEFYSSTQRRMQSATMHIWVTYVRLVPPPGFGSPARLSQF